MEAKQTCVVCGEEFELNDIEISIYEMKGFEKAPRRCHACRGSEKAKAAAVKPAKEMFSVICDGCGIQTQIPFKPKGDKPVYCSACFAQNTKTEKI
ncbi:MAG: zinc-ribbon domain containing protein [Clostridia bacterium]|nr:zinc-ribbon domain containing protein [Clostridia bacterium]